MPSLHPNLRTTILQAFARTVVDESRQGKESGEAAPVSGESSLPPSAVVLPAVDDVVGDHYKLVRLLGQGMFGKVYVAQRVDVPEHQVALKLLPRSLYAGRNVDRELVMLATVGHPHVVQLKDHGTTSDYVWLTMPVYQGETLAERLTRGPLSLREAHDIFLPIARGIDALHSAGLRHQDIKPENIYLAVFGGLVHPIILDLGVAAEKDATFVAGTALYAAPEQVAVLSGAHPWAMPLSEKMDTYGLAATLLVALVGPDLFPGEAARDREELGKAHAIRANAPLHPDALPGLEGPPRELIGAALARWMAIDPTERPTMSELAEQLDVLLEQEREERRIEERRRRRQRATIQRFKMVFGGMVLIGLAGAAVVFSKRETLELAGKLEQARKEGEKSFDRIETCNASYKTTTMDLTSCREARDKDRAEFKQSLEAVAKSGTTSQAENARQMQTFASRIKACEDTVIATQRACTDEAARSADEHAKQKAALEKARDEAKQLAEAARAEASALQQERDRCVTERLACVDERDACRKTASSAPPPTGPVATSSGHAAPAPVPATAVPATTGAPTSAPATPPPPPVIPPPSPSPPPVPPPPKPVPAPAPQAEDPYGGGP